MGKKKFSVNKNSWDKTKKNSFRVLEFERMFDWPGTPNPSHKNVRFLYPLKMSRGIEIKPWLEKGYSISHDIWYSEILPWIIASGKKKKQFSAWN